MASILVTGGAGYIGSHACKALYRAGFTPVTFDNLSTGHADAVRWGPLVRGDLLDREAVRAAFRVHRPIAVLHFAALSSVGESVQHQNLYWSVNLGGAINLTEAAMEHGCRNIVFSSTCATYGDHDGVVLDEDAAQEPINAYGASKRAVEEILTNYSLSHGLRCVIFRYFNVGGADPDGEIGERHEPETHLIPLALQSAMGKHGPLVVFGSDYSTPDGTCVRDYVHVSDLADAHVLGLKWLLSGGQRRIFNLGTGRGFSVRQVIQTAEDVVGGKVPVRWGDRRIGDAAQLVSGGQRAEQELGWVPQRSSLHTMIVDAWRWERIKAGLHPPLGASKASGDGN